MESAGIVGVLDKPREIPVFAICQAFKLAFIRLRHEKPSILSRFVYRLLALRAFFATTIPVPMITRRRTPPPMAIHIVTLLGSPSTTGPSALVPPSEGSPDSAPSVSPSGAALSPPVAFSGHTSSGTGGLAHAMH